jgi:hypothetical protein
MHLAPLPADCLEARWPWSNGDVWGSAHLRRTESGTAVTIEVARGSLKVRTICVGDEVIVPA